MSLSRCLLVPVAALCAACSTTTAPGAGDLSPPIEIQGAVAVESRLDTRLELPVSAQGGLLFTRLLVTNRLPESVSSGACTLASDARAMNGGAWRNVSPADQGCTRQLLVAVPGGSMSLSVVADQALLRAVAGGAGRTAVLRVRHLVSGAAVSYLAQSAEVLITAP